MTRHLKRVSQQRPMPAQDQGTTGFEFNILVLLTFFVNLLTAVDGLLTRKNETETS